MIPKIVLFGQEARNKILEGAEIIARAVGVTLGPKGRNVGLSSKYGGAITVHDGVTVANEIKVDDPTQDIGVTLIREAARKTNDASGDGTTTATVLAYQILKEGNTHITGVNPMLMKKGIDTAVKQAVEILKGMAEPIKDSLEKMIQVATVSAADEEIGKVIAEALKKVGKHGVVTVDKGTELGYHTEYKDGMEWDKGWIHPAFVFMILDGKPNIRFEAIVKEPFVLVTDHTITSPREIVPFLERFLEAGHKNLLIISDGIEREAMAILSNNFARGVLNVLPVSAPSSAEYKRDSLQDIAILTGGTFITKEQGRKVEDTQITDLGRAEKAVATKDSTVLTIGRGENMLTVEQFNEIKEKVKARAAQVEEQLREADHEYVKERYKERLAKLTSGVAVVKVGTASDTENRERMERVKDAIGATRAAVEEGIIPGGGVALLHVAQKLKTNLPSKEESIGAEILKSALLQPIRLLVENAGEDGKVVVNEVLKREFGIGYNVLTGEYVDMKKAGIVDPVKVTISAIQNASSVASMILTTEATVTDKPDPKREEKEQNG